VRRTRYREHFSASSFADNLTLGDVTEGEDPVVRAAAIEALGNMNGTAIAIDPAVTPASTRSPDITLLRHLN